MDAELKAEFRNLHAKIDGYMKHQEEICRVKHKPIDEHLAEAPPFRDRVVRHCEQITNIHTRMNWLYFAFTIVVISGIVLGVWIRR